MANITYPEERTSTKSMDRQQAWELLCEYAKTDTLRRHTLAVEACVAAYANKLGEDQTKWSVTALLHDFDYEIHPDPAGTSNPRRADSGRARCRSGNPARHSVPRHLPACHANPPLKRHSSRAMNSLDFLRPAPTLSRPARSETSSKERSKKLKDKAFARSVNRDDITQGALELGVDLDEHIAFCIEAMSARAAELGLAGPAAVTSAI